MWGTRIRGPKPSKPHWSTGNQWKSSFLETRYSEASRCGKHESDAQTPRKPIGRPGTNENRARRKHVILSYLDAGNVNPRPIHLENPLADREPMEIELAGNKLF
jgi:hypothetical protein